MRDQRGQASVEYLCLLVVLVALAGAVAAQMPGVGGSVACGVRGAIARAVGSAGSAAPATATLGGNRSVDDAIDRAGAVMGPPGGAGEIGRGPTQPGGRFGEGGGGEGGGRGEAEGERAAARADEYKTYAIAREEVLDRLDRESTPSSREGARGRTILVAEPAQGRVRHVQGPHARAGRGAREQDGEHLDGGHARGPADHAAQPQRELQQQLDRRRPAAQREPRPRGPLQVRPTMTRRGAKRPGA